jgi:Flp pilus assembly protein TadG
MLSPKSPPNLRSTLANLSEPAETFFGSAFRTWTSGVLTTATPRRALPHKELPMRIHHDERGQTIMLVALSLPLLLGFIGMATDVGALFKDKRTMQTAADHAAIMGALNLDSTNWQTIAKNATTSNGYTDGSNGVTVTVPSTPQWPASNFHNQANYVEVTITKTESTIFLALFGFPSVTVQARAVATNQGAGNGCVYTLGTTGTDLTVQGSPGITAPDCAFNVASNSTNAIVETGSGGSVITSSVAAVGNIGTSGWADFSPKPIGNATAVSDPLQDMQFPYTCSSTGCTCPSSSSICSTNPDTSMPMSCSAVPYVKNGTTSMSPGCYDLGGVTKLTAQDTINLSSGVYFFTNGTLQLQAGATMTATDVTMIMTGTATINMQGAPNLNITAPTDSLATFPGILYYQVPADTQPLNLQGGPNATIEGVFYAPAAAINLQGNAGGTIYTDFVSKSLSLLGNANFKSYAKLPGGSANGLHAIALVE